MFRVSCKRGLVPPLLDLVQVLFRQIQELLPLEFWYILVVLKLIWFALFLVGSGSVEYDLSNDEATPSKFASSCFLC